MIYTGSEMDLTESSDDPTHNQLGQIVGRTLQEGPDDHDGRAEEDGPPASQPVPEPDGGNGTKQTAQVVSRDSDT